MIALIGSNAGGSGDATELVLDRLSKTQKNAEFLTALKEAM